MNDELPALKVSTKSGDEEFKVRDRPIGHSILDFWKWYASDLSSNALRGVLAEFIVAMALVETDSTRLEWEPYDLETKSGIRIEVKSAAYIQSWQQKEFSKISFSINKTRGLDEETNAYIDELKRHADVYVFCVLKTKNQSILNPMDMDQWDFYVLPTRLLDESVQDQKTIALSSLMKLNPVGCAYSQLADAIDDSVKAMDNEI